MTQVLQKRAAGERGSSDTPAAGPWQPHCPSGSWKTKQKPTKSQHPQGEWWDESSSLKTCRWVSWPSWLRRLWHTSAARGDGASPWRSRLAASGHQKPAVLQPAGADREMLLRTLEESDTAVNTQLNSLLKAFCCLSKWPGSPSQETLGHRRAAWKTA